MNTIINHDLLQLIGASNWTQEEQVQAVNQFVIALGGFIKTKFGKNLDAKAEKELQKMLKNPQLKEKDLMDYFSSRVPDIYNKLEKYLIEFKTLFVTRVYEEKIRELEEVYDKNKDSIIMDELPIWKKILEYAKSNQWDQVVKLLFF